MTIQEKELFDFYTSIENFDTAIEVINYFPRIRCELLIQFWESVRQNISIKIGEKQLGYKIDLIADIFHKYSNLSIYKEEWGLSITDDSHFPISFCWNALAGDLHLGLWLNNDSDRWNKKELKTVFNNLKIRKQFSFDNDWWGMGRMYEYSFKEGKYQSLKLILPENQEKTANDFATTLIEFALNVEKEVNIISLLEKCLIK